MTERPAHAAFELPGGSLTSNQILIIAAAAGLSVANVYFAQPLLDLMAQDFHISSAAVGLIVTLTQVGYALGLIFIVPIGDLVDRHRLIVWQGLMSAIALVAVATAKSETVFFVSMAVMGLLAVLVQVLVAYAAALATIEQRGRVIGLVTGGVVIGILGARSVAGVVADLGGWRAVYAGSGLLTVLMMSLVMWRLPRQPPANSSENYIGALRSIPTLFLHDRILLLRGILALLIFASFSTLWTALVLPLSTAILIFPHADRPDRSCWGGGSNRCNIFRQAYR